jgi:hypothetical protein
MHERTSTKRIARDGGRLRPGMWLVLDEVAVERYFGRTYRDAFGIARAFAEMNNCSFQREGGKKAIPWSDLLSDGLAMTTCR